jgi:hypothetical protein
MLRKLKKPRILLALIISLSVPILSAYLLYCDIAGDDLSSSHATYENADVDDLFVLPDCQDRLDFSISIGPTALLTVNFFLETNAIEQMSPLCSPSSCLEQKNLVLRC